MRKLYSFIIAAIFGLFSFSNVEAQYCAISGGYSTSWDGIGIVATTGATSNFYSSTSRYGAGYRNYTSTMSATATAGTTFTLRISAQYGHRAFIDWDGNGIFTPGTNEEVASYPSTSSSYITRYYNVTVPTNASIGTNRIRVVSGYYSASSSSLQPTPCGYYGYRGETEDYTLVIQPPPPNDAGAAYAASTICPGTSDFQVRISNYGTNTLTSVTVQASFGATTYGPTTLTGLSVPTGGDTVITMGQYTASAGNNYSITASTSSPNGQTDGNTANDAYSGTLTPALRGVFTLGGSNPDYSTFSSFMSDLASSGVCDTTILRVRAGTYNERINLNNVNGADLVTAPIIIEADTGLTTKPLINYSSSYMVYVNGGHDFIIRGLQFGTTSSGNGYRVYFVNASEDIIFEDNDFVQRNVNSTSNFYAHVYSRTLGVNNIKFYNNSFDYGSYQIYAYANFSNRYSGWELDGNSFTNCYDYSVYSYYNDWDVFSNNYFGPNRENSFNYNVFVGYSDYTTFENNDFDQSTGPANQYGYNAYFNYCYYADFKDNTCRSVSNSGYYRYGFRFQYCRYSNYEGNYAELTGPGYGYAMYMYYPEQSTVERNEINISNAGSTTYGMYVAYPRGTTSVPTIFANNMVYQGALNANSIYGYYIWGSGVDNFEFIHNSTHFQLGSTNARAAYFTMSGSNINIRNNVFTNAGPGYAVYWTNSGYNRDNNCYYSNGGTTGYIGGATFTDLSSLQGISSTNDQNSLVYMPTYVSNTDLHMFYDKTIDQAGSPAATIVPEDWDGDQRDAVTPDIGLDEYLVPRNSVSLVTIDNPITPICALGGLYDITVLNVGTGTLNNFNVDGEVRHIGGGSTPLTTFTYNGAITTNGNASFNAGNFSSGFVNGDTLILWVSNPNGVNDSISNDDTLMVALTEGIRGLYTVGDTSGGNPSGYDFGTLAAVEHMLDSVGAICDTVVFELADGSYAGNITLHELIGTAPDRPVIFRSENADPSLVDISSGAAATITLDGADNVHILDMTIANTSNGSATVYMDGNNDNVTIDNCIVENASTGTATYPSAIRGEGSAEQNNLTITNNHISGGAHGISIGGNGSNGNENLVITDNTVEDADRRGIQVNYAEGFMINGNEIMSSSSYTSGEAILVENSTGMMEMMDNKIMNYDVWPRYTIRIQNSSALSSNYAKIANNVIHTGTNTSGIGFYGIYMNNTSFMDVNHNTIALEGTSTGTATLYINGGGANEVRNNNLANMGNGRAIEVYSTYALTYSDYNNLFTNGAQVGRFDSQNSVDFAAWQNNTGVDQNSVSVDPMFYSMQDLKVCAADLDGAGVPTYVMYDMDDQMRDANFPDIGADEFTAPSNFSLPADTQICKGDEITFNALLNTGSFAIWNNFQPAPTLTISQAGVYRVFASNQCGQAIDSIEVTENAPATLPNDTHICANVTLTLDPQVSNGTYNWSTGAATQAISVNSRGIYAVEVTDASGCVTTDTVAITESRAVELPADTAFCAGNTYVLNANVGQGSYFWSPTGTTGPVLFAQTSGNYGVNYVDNMGCQSYDEIRIDVVDEPEARFNYFNLYYSVAFNDQSADARSYLWVFGDGDSSTVANPTHRYPGPNRYRVQLYVENDCGTDMYEDVINIGALPGFAENLEVGEFNVYPNPNTGNFSITMNASAEDYSIEVMNVEGKVVFNTALENTVPGINTVEVNLNEVSTGVYFVRVTGQNDTKVQKINIQ